MTTHDRDIAIPLSWVLTADTTTTTLLDKLVNAPNTPSIQLPSIAICQLHHLWHRFAPSLN
jgi:hypothetical protein